MRVPFTEGLVIKCQNRMLKNRVTASWSKNSQKYFAKGMELEASDAAKNKKKYWVRHNRTLDFFKRPLPC